MTSFQANVFSLARRPSGFIPVLMSLAALAIVLSALAIAGPVRQADEGAAAHLFQLLVAGQLPVLAYFIVKWAPKHATAALIVLAAQAAALALAFVPVWWFRL